MCFACGMYQINLPSHGRIPCSPTRLIASEANWDFGYITLTLLWTLRYMVFVLVL